MSMPTLPLSAAEALALSERLAGASALIASLELLARRRSLARGGLLGWEVVQLRSAWLTHGRLARCLDTLFTGSGLLLLVILRAAAAAWLVVGHTGAAHGTVVVVAALTTLLLMLRTSFGNDGADQMCLLVLLAGAIARASGARPAVLEAALWFIALQACLSYATSGIAKLWGGAWRDGSGIVGILSTHTYGLPALATLFTRRPALAVSVSWMIIASEALFPLVLVAPEPWIPAVLAGGLTFHLGCAVVMGLNTFIWSFAAAYPAIYWVTSR
jgi:hypothetical protein